MVFVFNDQSSDLNLSTDASLVFKPGVKFSEVVDDGTRSLREFIQTYSFINYSNWQVSVTLSNCTMKCLKCLSSTVD